VALEIQLTATLGLAELPPAINKLIPHAAKSSFQNESYAAGAALGGARRRPRSHPYLFDTSAPCVLASHPPSAPRRRAPF
jgi:hypothetical protein